MQLDDRVIYPMAWYQGAGVCSLLAFLLPLIFTLQPSVWPSLLLLCLSPFSFLPWPFYHPLPLSPSYCNFLLAFHDQATKLVQFISWWVIKASLQNWLEDSKLWVNTTVDATFFFLSDWSLQDYSLYPQATRQWALTVPWITAVLLEGY